MWRNGRRTGLKIPLLAVSLTRFRLLKTASNPCEHWTQPTLCTAGLNRMGKAGSGTESGTKSGTAFGASVNGGFSVASGTAHLWTAAQRNVTEGPAFFLGAVASSNRATRALGFAFLNLAQAQSAMRHPAPKKGEPKRVLIGARGEGGFGYCKPKFRILHRIRSQEANRDRLPVGVGFPKPGGWGPWRRA